MDPAATSEEISRSLQIEVGSHIWSAAAVRYVGHILKEAYSTK